MQIIKVLWLQLDWLDLSGSYNLTTSTQITAAHNKSVCLSEY